MKKVLIVFGIIFSFSTPVCFADSHDTQAIQQLPNKQQQPPANSKEIGVRREYLAEQKVKILPSKHGDTIDSYMSNMASIPMAEDLGWEVHPLEDGYEVERSIQVNNTKTFRYKWKVSNSGEVSPVNDIARALMK